MAIAPFWGVISSTNARNTKPKSKASQAMIYVFYYWAKWYDLQICKNIQKNIYTLI